MTPGRAQPLNLACDLLISQVTDSEYLSIADNPVLVFLGR